MRKSNVLIISILVVASVAFLWLWNYLQFNLVHNLDLVITIIWWVVIAALCVAIHRVEQKRRERMRTVFVSNGVLYNSEAGVVRIDTADPQSYVRAICKLLNNLNYGTHAKVDSNQPRLRFSYIIHSPKFSDNGKVWEGDVVRVAGSGRPIDFKNSQELLRILQSEGVAV